MHQNTSNVRHPLSMENTVRKPVIRAWPLVGFAILIIAFTLDGRAAYAEPMLTEAQPPDGQTLEQPPDVQHLCFSEPVKVEDPADFRFTIRAPDGRQPGSRNEFQPDGLCVNVYAGKLDGEPAGIWELDWVVHSQADGSEGSGVIRVQVGGDFGLTPAPTLNPSGKDGGGGGDSPWIAVAVGAGAVIGLGAAAGVVLALRARRQA